MVKTRGLQYLLLPIVLLSLIALIALQRLHTYHEPLERDITLYAVFGHELLNGRGLYADLWDIKPPALYLTYAGAEKLVGYGPGQIYFLGVIAAIITMMGAYAAGSGFSGRVSTGLWAAAFWTVLCSDLGLYANQPNTEVFMNAALIWAFALLVKSTNHSLGRFVIIGLLFALASLYKPVVAVIAVILGLMHMVTAGDAGAWRRAAMQVVVMGAMGLISWVGLCAYYFLAGNFSPFYDTMFVFNRFYAGNIWENFKEMLKPGILLPPYLRLPAALLIPAGFGMLLGLSKTPRRSWLLFLGWALGTQIAIALPGKFFFHYYQLWLPLMAVFGAWGLEELELSKLFPRWIPAAVGVAALLVIGVYELSFYKYSAEEWSRRKSGYGEVFISSAKMGRELGQLLKPGETFYEWGFETGLYFYSQLRPPSGVFFSIPLVAGPLTSTLTDRVLADLERNQPELFLTMGKEDLAAETLHPVLEWFKNRYRFFETRPPFVLYARQGGRLDSRTKLEPAELNLE